jgi:hypothetical protein
MIFIVGLRSKVKQIGEMRGWCGFCNRETLMKELRKQNYFTFFFIPLFPVSKAKTYRQCQLCGSTYPITYQTE